MCDYSWQMFPIIGDRYRCADCTEKMGFDLCGDCYASRSKLPGRFNQQHTSEHKFKLEQSNIIHNIMLRLATAQLGDTSIDLESVGNLEIASDSPTMFDDGEDNHSDSETTNWETELSKKKKKKKKEHGLVLLCLVGVWEEQIMQCWRKFVWGNSQFHMVGVFSFLMHGNLTVFMSQFSWVCLQLVAIRGCFLLLHLVQAIVFLCLAIWTYYSAMYIFLEFVSDLSLLFLTITLIIFSISLWIIYHQPLSLILVYYVLSMMMASTLRMFEWLLWGWF